MYKESTETLDIAVLQKKLLCLGASFSVHPALALIF